MSMAPQTAAPSGRKKGIGDQSLAIGDAAKPPPALGHESQNTSSPVGAKEMAQFPVSWTRARLGEVVAIKYGKTLPTAEFTESGYPVFGANGIIGTYSRYLYEDRQVLISCRGAYSGTINLSPPLCFITNNSLVLEIAATQLVSKEYLFYALQTVDKSKLVTGSAQPQVTINNAEVLDVPLAPFPEQQRIVAEIEKQFTRLEAGVAALRRVQANLKRYRAAVLKTACEGRLVPTEAELTRSQHSTKNSQPAYETGEALLARILTERRQNWQGRGQYKQPAAPDTTKLPPLPEGWIWATAQQLNLSNRPCAYGVLQPGDDIPDGVPFVRVGDINNGKVDLSALKHISPAIADQYPRTKLHGGELAITLVGAIGRTAVIPESLAGGNTARAVGIIPLTKETNAHWTEIWFRNPAKSAEMDSKSHEVARKTLNLEDVRVASVALPPLVEQVRIVAEVERRLSVVEELEAVVSANLQRATRLRQSILTKAFGGRCHKEKSMYE